MPDFISNTLTHWTGRDKTDESAFTYWEASKYLTGLIFIEDKFGDLEFRDTSVGAIYLNPNATNLLGETYEYNLLKGQGLAEVFDDFKHDNY